MNIIPLFQVYLYINYLISYCFKKSVAILVSSDLIDQTVNNIIEDIYIPETFHKHIALTLNKIVYQK